MYGVIKFQAPFERLKEYDYSPEVRLHKAILAQAIIDSTNVTSGREAKKHEIEAKNWIFGNSDCFRDICCVADMDPGFVIKVAREAIKLNAAKAMGFCVESKRNNRRKKKDESNKEKTVENFVYSNIK
ncbi:hypothetical protein N9N97_00825 [Rickettsiaceae bacterium]|nr:hypothetical protein [Rickettsiaceae bacterium]